MRTNYHTHTYRCKHADGTEEEYVIEAIDKKLDILGFSDHCPYKKSLNDLRMSFSEFPDYINTISSLKDKYKDKISIKCGVEIEYNKSNISFYDELLSKYKLNYLLFGQHFFIANNIEYNSYDLDDTSLYLDYAKSVIEGMKTGYFKALAHPDVVFINNNAWDINCDKMIDFIINESVKNDLILEFNANGLRRGKIETKDGDRFPYPVDKFWDKVSKTNIKVIISSDCHKPSYVWDKYMEEAHKIAKKYKLNIIDKLF